MQHLSLPHRVPKRSCNRRALSVHRPRPPTWDRVQRNRRDLRLSDVILGMLGLTLLGALGIMAGAVLLGRTLTP
ncbi:hypothetical protein ASF60_13505 [Methylobacterium sp. Leaf113]|uniref:hypothetical protein n=1 Tax=Methylobacterium sp. Leaf113 TaxID=1736259 RepID=UPI0006FE70F8|nr:hypothetical protein [Methylobacterium sp. Leaf113]KQP94115.1 hypothetical protein ASF60_13505 [Methylobacterium sp. Leaf113]